MGRRIGLQTVEIESKPRIIGTYNIVGPKEGQGPLKEYFDKILEDDLNGTESFEKAESFRSTSLDFREPGDWLS